MRKATRAQWIKFGIITLLYLIFLVWVRSWLGLIVVPFIFDIYISKKIPWSFWKNSKNPAPAPHVHGRKAPHQRIAHDGQHGRNENVNDDRREVPDQEEHGRSGGSAGNEPQEGLGSRFHGPGHLFGRLLAQTRDGRLRADDGIADLDEQFAVLRHEHIDARTELDETADAVLFDGMAHLHIGDDPARDQSGDLPEKHLLARRHPHHGRRALVLGGGFGMPRHQKPARMVLEVLHLAAYGNPVHVDIGDGHENRNLQHLAAQDTRSPARSP